LTKSLLGSYVISTLPKLKEMLGAPRSTFGRNVVKKGSKNFRFGGWAPNRK